MGTAKTGERMVIQKWTAGWKVEAERGKDWRQKNDKGTVHELIVHDFLPQNSTLERGMCTRAKQAWTLLIASGLPRALWKEAMKHSAWIQNWTLTCILQGRIPYKENYKKKPNLVGIQEFGVAAYVKEMTVGKLDSWAQMGWFVGYDSESKGYSIYWPNKRTVSIEWNVVFNDLDVYSGDSTTVLQEDVSAEGERDKIIQPTQNHSAITDERIQSAQNKNEPTKHPPPSHGPDVSIKPSNKALPNLDETSERGHLQHARKHKGSYKLMLLFVRQAHICSCRDDRAGTKGLEVGRGAYMLVI